MRGIIFNETKSIYAITGKEVENDWETYAPSRKLHSGSLGLFTGRNETANTICCAISEPIADGNGKDVQPRLVPYSTTEKP